MSGQIHDISDETTDLGPRISLNSEHEHDYWQANPPYDRWLYCRRCGQVREMALPTLTPMVTNAWEHQT